MEADEQIMLAQDGKNICRYLEISPSEAKNLRRSIRKKIRPKSRSISGMEFLHRSPESRQLFRVAVKRAVAKGETALSSPCLLESLFASGMIALDTEGQLVYGEK